MKNLFFFLFLIPCFLFSQEEQDSVLTKRKSEFLLLPATAYTPETGFTIGAFNEYYFDFAEDGKSRMSKVQFGGIYTTKKQMYFGAALELFSKDELYYSWISVKYSNFIDRDYGLGNDAREYVIQNYLENNKSDTLNFIDFSYQSAGGEVVFLRKLHKKGLYGGLHYRYETLWDYSLKADEILVRDGNVFSQLQNNEFPDDFRKRYFIGTRSGVGLAFSYDTRKNSNNPLKGEYVNFRNWYYRPWMGSSYDYTGISLDARKYINTYKNHTLAMRFRSEQRYAHEESLIPKFDLARVGGKDNGRGYYDGTYIGNHLLQFEVEYRLPIYLDYDSKIWQFWKRLGIVAFASGSRVYQSWDELSFKDIRYTIGMGGRFMLSMEQQVNARLDIGYGLDPKSNFDKRNIGIYIYIAEAF